MFRVDPLHYPLILDLFKHLVLILDACILILVTDRSFKTFSRKKLMMICCVLISAPLGAWIGLKYIGLMWKGWVLCIQKVTESSHYHIQVFITTLSNLWSEQFCYISSSFSFSLKELVFFWLCWKLILPMVLYYKSDLLLSPLQNMKIVNSTSLDFPLKLFLALMTNMSCHFFYQISEWKLTKLLQNPFQIKNIWIQLEMSLTEIQIHPISLIFGLDKEATSYTDMILPKNVQVFREVQRGRKMVGGLTSGRRDSAFQDNHQFLVSGIRDGRRYFG